MTKDDRSPQKKKKKRRSGRRRKKPEYESYDEAWDGATDDRFNYNLGDGCRRVPPKGISE